MRKLYSVCNDSLFLVVRSTNHRIAEGPSNLEKRFETYHGSKQFSLEINDYNAQRENNFDNNDNYCAQSRPDAIEISIGSHWEISMANEAISADDHRFFRSPLMVMVSEN